MGGGWPDILAGPARDFQEEEMIMKSIKMFAKNFSLIWRADKKLLSKCIAMSLLRLSVWPLVIPEYIFTVISTAANEVAYWLETPAIKINRVLIDYEIDCLVAVRRAGLMKTVSDAQGGKK